MKPIEPCTVVSVVVSSNQIPMSVGRNAVEAWGGLGRFGWRENRRYHRANGWKIVRFKTKG